jgi:hypothetical protein
MASQETYPHNEDGVTFDLRGALGLDDGWNAAALYENWVTGNPIAESAVDPSMSADPSDFFAAEVPMWQSTASPYYEEFRFDTFSGQSPASVDTSGYQIPPGSRTKERGNCDTIAKPEGNTALPEQPKPANVKPRRGRAGVTPEACGTCRYRKTRCDGDWLCDPCKRGRIDQFCPGNPPADMQIVVNRKPITRCDRCIARQERCSGGEPSCEACTYDDAKCTWLVKNEADDRAKG